jgi:cytochrome P450
MTDALTGVDVGLQDIPDIHRTLRSLRERAPWAPVTYYGFPAVLLLTHELVAEAFRDEETFPAAATYEGSTGPVLGRTLQCMGGEEHRVNRALVSPTFRPARIAESVRALLEPVAQELTDALTGSVDLVEEFADRYPFRVIVRLLGLPEAAEQDLKRWAYDLFRFPVAPEPALAASEEFTRYLEPHLAERRHAPADDLLSTLAVTEVEGERLTDEEIYAFVRLLFPAGADTTSLGLANMLYGLLRDPALYERVIADPAQRRWAVEETLRWEPPVGLLPRIAPKSAHWHGISIDANTPVIFAVTAANRDPAVHADPDTFDLDRHATAQLAFGGGPHYCLGAHLARAEMATALGVLAERLPRLRLEADPVEIRGRLSTALRGPDHLMARTAV